MPEKILVVDDSVANRRFLQRALGNAGYDVVEASHGDQVMDSALGASPDLVILNAAVPGKDGLHLCQELKNDSRTVGTPVIMMSPHDEPSARIRGLDAGADDYLVLPFEISEVMARVRSQLRLGQLTKHLVQAGEKLAKRQRRLDRDIAAAANIRGSLLPHPAPRLPNLEVRWRFRPCPLVGGDLFNVQRLDERTVGMYIVDVSGHGVPAAMVTVSLAQALEPRSGITKRVFYRDGAGAYELPTPSQVLIDLNREYAEERFGRRIDLCYLTIDVESGELRYANAGHVDPLLRTSRGGWERLSRGGPPLGHGVLCSCEEGRYELARGDRVFLYNEGLVNLPSREGEHFGPDRLLATLEALGDGALDHVCAGAMDAALGHSGGGDPPHDVAIIGLEFTGGAEG